MANELSFTIDGANDEPETWVIVGPMYEREQASHDPHGVWIDFKDLYNLRIGPVPDTDNRHWTHDVRRTIIERAATQRIQSSNE